MKKKTKAELEKLSVSIAARLNDTGCLTLANFTQELADANNGNLPAHSIGLLASAVAELIKRGEMSFDDVFKIMDSM